MADILFRYLLMARQQDTSWVRRLFLQNDSFTTASVEQIVETAAARISATVQFERVSRETHSAPASKFERLNLCDVAEPNRPRPPHCESRIEQFGLRESAHFIDCHECQGKGKMHCSAGHGQGSTACPGCNGSGLQFFGRESACPRCGGSGGTLCLECGGKGEYIHKKCQGEGRLVTWIAEVHQYFVRSEQSDVLPVGALPQALRSAIDRWLADHPEIVHGLDERSVVDHLGYGTAAAIETAHAARRQAETLVQKIQNETTHAGVKDNVSNVSRLFASSTVQLAPVASCLIRSSSRVARYWLVGRGERAIEIAPTAGVEPRKLAGWAGTLAAGVALTAGASLTIPGEIGLGVAGMAGIAAGLTRAFHRGRAVKTVAVLPAAGRTTSYLSCLAAIGSLLQAFYILDRDYSEQLKKLLGAPPSPRQSTTVTLALSSGVRVRLVEVAQAGRFSADQFRQMVHAVDGILFLEEPGASASRLRSHVEIANAGPKPQATLVLADPDDPSALAAEGPLSLELVRRAFIRDVETAVDWRSIFQRLAGPLAEILGERILAPVARASAPGRAA